MMRKVAAPSVALSPGFLRFDFDAPQRTLSWAIHGGGSRTASCVAFVEVRNADLSPEVDPLALLRARLEAHGALDGIGLLTSRDLRHYVTRDAEYQGQCARCVATVGLSNALRAGDVPGPARHPARVGTINLVCWTSVPLSDDAALEAMSIAVEARTLAIHEQRVTSTQNALHASGTGTDCVVLAWPPSRTATTPYAGKHTAVGHLVGAAVYAAVRDGARVWCAERARSQDGVG